MTRMEPHPAETASDAGGYLVPIGPMGALACDSCE